MKVLCILASVTVIGLGFMSIHFAKSGAVCDTITLSGEITPDSFLAVKDCLVQSSAKNKTFIVTESGGGNWESALALGILIHRHGWNVEVVDLCASSCANFIFPAGKVKYLHSNAMLLFHGGPHQHNVDALAMEVDRAKAVNSAPSEAKDLGRANMEGHIVVDAERAAERLQVYEFLSIKDASSTVELFARLTKLSDQFYEELGVNPLLPNYGQIGKYEPIYKSYKYGGFMYRLDSLRKLGIGNIEVMNGGWHPERHRDYPNVYEVTYP